MCISYTRLSIIFVATLGMYNSAFSLEKEFFVVNKKFFTELFKEHLVDMQKCFTESDNKLLCKKLFINFNRDEKRMTNKRICQDVEIVTSVKNGKSFCENMYDENKINEYEYFVYKHTGFFSDPKESEKLIPEMLSSVQKHSSRKHSLNGKEALYSKVSFDIYYPTYELKTMPDGKQEYVEQPPIFGFTKVNLYYRDDLKLSSIEDFIKNKDHLIVNFNYTGASDDPIYDEL